ncbi:MULTISPECIES: DUF945 family protein [unclassified Agarivorans]|uniref:DUF945 family protein n=1 Tax=unclassified Agarivorans TaxID=2636026 RepID=UPI0026E35AE4|nr:MULTISPECIES: DUF945 family protein [unclassified Agarivorans]MDO6685443.1 DUF945 family protein [Agarivorans sp. 3_MG-2023]MDO6715829.1 DUF945 family protein [Agarivorans sp. 2_MG-2023]
MLKKSIMALATLVAITCGAQYLSHTQYRQQVKQIVADFNQQNEWQISQTVLSSSWFQQQEQWQLTGNLSQLGLDPQPIELHVIQQVSIWPLWLEGKWQVDPEQASYQQWLSDLNLAAIPHLGTWQANLLSQKLQQQLRVDTFEHNYTELALNFKPMSISTVSDLSFQQGEATLSWQGMELLDSQQNGDHIHLGKVEASETFSQRQQWTLVENASWSVEQLRLQLGQGETLLKLQNLSVNNSFSEIKKNAYLSLNTELNSFILREGAEVFQLDQLLLRSSLGGVPMQSLIQLAQSKYTSLSSDELDVLVQQAVSNGIEWQLDTLVFEVDSSYNSLPLQGDINLAGKAKLLPFKLGEVSSPIQLLRYIDLNLAIDVGDQLFNQSPLSAYILALRNAGYLLHEEGRDRSELIFNDNEFTMNNMPVN